AAVASCLSLRPRYARAALVGLADCFAVLAHWPATVACAAPGQSYRDSWRASALQRARRRNQCKGCVVRAHRSLALQSSSRFEQFPAEIVWPPRRQDALCFTAQTFRRKFATVRFGRLRA